jgi:hypothetical protein
MAVLIAAIAIVVLVGAENNQRQIGFVTFAVNKTGAFYGPFYVTNPNGAEYNVNAACILSSAYAAPANITSYPGPAAALIPVSTMRYGQNQSTKNITLIVYYNSTIPANQILLALSSRSIQCFSPSGIPLSNLRPGNRLSGALYFNYTNSSGPVSGANPWHTWGLSIPNMTVVSNFSSVTVFSKFMRV